MLIDLHAHTSGISKCCRKSAPEIIADSKALNIDGFVLTNHYVKSYINGSDYKGFIDKYIAEYEYTKALGEAVGFKVFFGIEVTVEKNWNLHYLIYGVDKNFLYENPTLYDYTQQELYSKVKSAGGAMVQAHPFRKNVGIRDLNYLDGLEINCHPLYGDSFSKEIIKSADEAGVMVTCGGDYHADTYRPYCGVYLPQTIKTDRDIADYICLSDKTLLCVQEPNVSTYYDLEYKRKK